MAESDQSGPCGIYQNQLIENGARLNGAFSEFAWANARQNSGCMPCPSGDLPSWPPRLNDWGHTYPVQSKHGETIIGSQMNACGEAPFNMNAQPDWGQRTHNPPQIFERFVTTDVPRDSSPEAREYDVALDVAEKILRGDSLALHDSESKPFSYAQDLYGLDHAIVNPSGRSRTDPRAYSSGHNNSSNKRLENLLEPTTTRDSSTTDVIRYGSGHGSEKFPVSGIQNNNDNEDDSHSLNNLLPCVKNTFQGVSYDLVNWNNISDEKCQGNKLYYIFVRDDRWKYLSFVGICIVVFVLFIVAIASSMNNVDDCSSSNKKILSTANIINGNEPQKIEIIVKQA